MMRVILALAATTTTTALVAPSLRSARSPTRVRSIAENVAQTQETSRDKVMTFSYDTERERAYEKPTYKGTGDGMGGGDAGDEYDVVVIGSGMGGLACGAMCAKYGEKAIVLESHIKMGGSAHSFTKVHNKEKYSFEVGPSIFEGLDKPSLNPLRILLDVLDSELPVETYQGLAYWVPTSNFDGTGPVKYWRFQLGDVEAPGGFYESLREHASDGELAIKEFEALRSRLKTLGGSTTAVCLFNLRQDPGFLATTAGSLPYVATHPDVFADLPLTFDSLHKTVDQLVTEPFLRNFIDTMCIFCGFPAKGAMTAHMLYILERFFEPGCSYSVPKGGTENIARALHRGGAQFGMDISLNTHVAEILVEGGRACGVRLKSGKVIRARKAVVSNATPFDTVKMLPAQDDLDPEMPGFSALQEWRQTLGTLPRHGAILHLFVAVDAEKVVDGKKLADHPSWRAAEDETAKNPAHLIVQDWSRSMQDSQNLCSFFIPSLLDRSVCPEGKHVIHVYSSGGEPYEPWEQLEPGSEAYEAYKEERANILWEALENCIPDARARAEFHIVGSPLAHEAFLRRDRGTYGMAWAAGTSAPYAGLLKFTPIPFPFPNLKTPVDGLLRCGDSCFPGIGTPSAAASGVIAANTIVNVETHIAMLEETAKKDPMYKFLSPGPFQWLYRGLVSPLTPSKELRGSGVFQPSSGGRVSAAAEAASR
ncbi:all-trans-retinol 13,14-reductase [Aureococcus anophagefferens]|uniref:All-trans-retinol 13,14-reductase n=1 Tax=Aureococcus anophagefferens TaxID=44056 RepID=A0ABR1G3T3_AURAN